MSAQQVAQPLANVFAMNNDTALPSTLLRLQQATRPAAEGDILGKSIDAALWIVGVVAYLAATRAAFQIDTPAGVLALLCGAAGATAAAIAPYRIRQGWIGVWVATLSLVAANLFAPSLDAASYLILLVGTALGVVLVRSRWLGRLAAHATTQAGWSPIPPSRHSRVDMMDGDFDGLFSHNKPKLAQWLPRLRQALATLPDNYHVLEQRKNTDAIVTGPCGVVTISSVDLNGQQVSWRETHNDPQIIHSGIIASRERRGDLVYGSNAWNAKKLGASVDATQQNDLIAAYGMAGELIYPSGMELGHTLPAYPVMYANQTLAALLGMGLNDVPTVIYVAHGLDMDRPWATVQIKDSHRGYIGQALVCHPDYLAECVRSLPVTMPSEAAVVAAHVSVDIHTR